MIKTVSGDIQEKELGITLVHEHICCYSEYLFKMAGDKYLDKNKLQNTSVCYLKSLKEKYGLNTIVDCTPINIGRDIDLLKRVSEQSEVNVVCSTGFYYTDEPVLYNTSDEQLCEYMVDDAYSVNAGIIKCAVEDERINDFQQKLLRACAKAHLQTGLPIVMHTNAKNKNAIIALETVLSEGVKANAVTVAHMSDTDDLEYVKNVASYGCYIGLDRLHNKTSEEYVSKKVESIIKLCDAGYRDKILLSHDALFFNGFNSDPEINEKPRFSYCFDNILPNLSNQLAEKTMIENPIKMLSCGE